MYSLIITISTLTDEIRNGAYRELFHPNSLLTGKEDAASNFARGYFGVGREMIDVALNRVRIASEDCSQLQGFIIVRSFGGGTGSGFTPLVLEGLNKDYGKLSKIEYAVYPAPKISPIIVEPYNAVLTSHACMDITDVAFIFDNEALYDILARDLEVPRPTYTNLNRLVAQVSIIKILISIKINDGVLCSLNNIHILSCHILGNRLYDSIHEISRFSEYGFG